MRLALPYRQQTQPIFISKKAIASPLKKRDRLVGLTRGFMFAGAKRIMPTLWNISANKPTGKFLTPFFDYLLDDEDPLGLELDVQKQTLKVLPSESWDTYLTIL